MVGIRFSLTFAAGKRSEIGRYEDPSYSWDLTFGDREVEEGGDTQSFYVRDF